VISIFNNKPSIKNSKMKKTIIRECIRTAIEKNKYHPVGNGLKRHFSFIIQDNKIIEIGFNKNQKPLPGYPEYSKIHSENDAFRKAKGLINFSKRWDVINIKITKRGLLRLSKPCKCCFRFLSNLGCHSVVFTTGLDYSFSTIYLKSSFN
jgi:hypothetical protein